MKQLMMRVFDALMPPGIKEFGQAEELARARTLIFLQLLTLSFAIMSVVGAVFVVLFVPSTLDAKVPFLLLGSVFGYALSIWIFRVTGHNVPSGNVLAFTYYATIVIGMLPMSGQVLIGGILYLLALPFLATLIANYTSGIVWVVLVAMAPVLLQAFGKANLEPFFLANWVALSMGLFIAIYGSHTYVNSWSQRVHVERSWLEFVAGHDSLTGAANRATFDRRLIESIALCKLHGTQSVLVYIDLDKFKPINDVHGHQAGDIVLTAVADRLRRLVRRSDTVARLGGDEFAILFDQCSPEGVKPVLDRIATVVGAPMDVLGKELSVGCSLGIVICPDDGFDPKQLAQKADERMYEAKRKAGSGRTPEDLAARRIHG